MSEERKDISELLKEYYNRPLELIEENKKLKKKIDKLEKENEQLKEEIKKQYKQYIKDHTEVIENLKKDSISKDIIRDKIKELEERDKMFKLELPEDVTIYQYGIEILNELLGE